MHILQLVPSLDVGGVERGVLDLTKGLVQRGHRVSVVSAGGALVEPLTRLGAMHYTMPVHRKSPWSVASAIPALCQLIQETQVEVVHARSRVPGWIGFAACRRTQTPFVTTCHGFYRPHAASWVMGWGRVVIAPSQALARYLIDHLQVPPERLRVIPRGVDLSEFQFRAAAFQGSPPWRIGVIGRLSTLKGHDVAIRALQHLRRQGLSVTLYIIGEAPAEKPQLRQQLERLAGTLGVASSIKWWGKREDIPTCLATLDVLLAPSTYPESFGRTVVEAQAVGVPVVASRLGAFPEILEDGVTGLLVEPGNFVALADGAARLLQDAPLRQRLVQQARQRVETQFSLDRMVEATLDVYDDCVRKPRVVVWKMSALGDVVLATPSFRAIRRHFPQSPVSLVAGRPVYEVVARCPYVSEVIVYDPRGKDRTWRGRWRFIRRLRQAAFDVSIDLQNSRFTHLAAWLAGIPVRIGYDRRWGRLLTRAVALPREAMDPVSHQHHLLTAAGLTIDGAALELWPSEQDEARLAALLTELGVDHTKPLVGVHPGGSQRWKTKRWNLARWAALCDRLAAQGARVVVTGAAGEEALGQQLLQLTTTAPAVAIGKTRLMELACLIRRCRVFVTNDSAPLHVAAAMGTPTVALFGPTDPARHLVPGPAIRVIKKDVFCSPCYSTWCRTITHACMERISVEEVLQTITECGMGHAEWKRVTPHSALRTPHAA